MSVEIKIPTEQFTRCCGYYRPVEQMNPGVKEQVKERKLINTKEIENELSVLQGNN